MQQAFRGTEATTRDPKGNTESDTLRQTVSYQTGSVGGAWSMCPGNCAQRAYSVEGDRGVHRASQQTRGRSHSPSADLL